MANITGASLGPIYERLNGAPEYHPLEADTFADWALEAGDVVTVERDGKQYVSPVHSSVVTWRKGQKVSVSSTGNESREPVSKVSQKKYRSGSSGLRNTNYMHWYVDDQYNQMRTGLELTGSSAVLYARSKYDEMGTGLKLTASSAVLYASNKYAEMSTGLSLTASTAVLYASNKYSEMSTGLSLTASTAVLYASNKYSEMSTGLQLSTSSAVLYASNKYNEMKSGLALTASSAALFVQNETTQAKIIAKINGDGSSQALIKADKITLDGSTALSGYMSISSGNLAMSGLALLNGGATVSGANLKLLTSSKLEFNNTTPSGASLTIGYDDIKTAIKSASVSGNTLTLTPYVGDAITFNKASGSTKVSGAWSGGTYEVSANNIGQELPISTSLGLYRASWEGNTCTVQVGYYLNPITGYADTGCSFPVTYPGGGGEPDWSNYEGDWSWAFDSNVGLTLDAGEVVDIEVVDKNTSEVVFTAMRVKASSSGGAQRTITEVCTLSSDKSVSIPVKFKYSDGSKNTINTTVLSQAQWDAY